MTESVRVLAVDLGASSVRVAEIDLAETAPAVHIIHRWHHGPVPDDGGSLRWDWDQLVAEVRRGIDKAMASGPVASIGVDGWGVDYALLDANDRLVAQPYSYRDARTAAWEETASRVGRRRIYELTGIQLMGINSIFQLAVHQRSELERAGRLLLLPDLLTHELTGCVGAERSNASTTGLLDAGSGDWSRELIEAIEVDARLFPPVVAAGETAGTYNGVPVHVVGSHDTASAFLGMPGGGTPGTVFVSTGTWVIVGVERAAHDISPAAFNANFSNEAGAFGGFRFLKNVVGFWMLEQCRPSWGNPPIGTLIEEAGAVSDEVPIFDASADRFVSTTDMVGEILAATGLPTGSPRGVVARSVLESIAAAIARVVAEVAKVTGAPAAEIAVVGGGARTRLLHELIARHTGLPVVVGSAEATALGNAVAQGIGLGYFGGLGDGRRWLESTGRRV